MESNIEELYVKKIGRQPEGLDVFEMEKELHVKCPTLIDWMQNSTLTPGMQDVESATIIIAVVDDVKRALCSSDPHKALVRLFSNADDAPVETRCVFSGALDVSFGTINFARAITDNLDLELFRYFFADME